MSELRRRLVTADARSAECGDGHGDVRQMAESGDASTKSLPTSVTTVTSCGCTKHQGVNVHVTLICPCARTTTADASTQTDDEVMGEDVELSRNKEYGASHAIEEKIVPKTLPIQRKAKVYGIEEGPRMKEHSGTTPRGYADKPSGFYNAEDLDSSELQSPESHQRKVTETVARACDKIFEVLREMPRPLADTSNSGIFDTMFPMEEMSQSFSASVTAHDLSFSANQTFPCMDYTKSLAESIFESMEAHEEKDRDPRLDAPKFLVSDELYAIYDHIESRWAEVCSKLRASLNSRYDQFLADCRRCLHSEQRESEREQLRQDMVEARRELLLGMKEEFRAMCEEYDQWRVGYLEGELDSSCLALRQKGQSSVLAAVLRFEILKGLPELEQRTRARAVALWKELMEQMEPDEDAFQKKLA